MSDHETARDAAQGGIEEAEKALAHTSDEESAGVYAQIAIANALLHAADVLVDIRDELRSFKIRMT